MNYKLIILPNAERDIFKLKSWYEQIEEGLSQRFIFDLDRTLLTIEERPTSFRTIHRDIRKIITTKFPSLIFFYIIDSNIYVHRVFHARSNYHNLIH